jgi:hypothetical protein
VAIGKAQLARDREEVAARFVARDARAQRPEDARGLSRVSLPAPMDAGDTSKEGSGTQPGAGDTSTEESSAGREDKGKGRLAQAEGQTRSTLVQEQPESAAMGAG